MKRIVERTLDAIVGLLMLGCIFGGIILMICECADWERQVSTMVLGFVLFCIGAVPAAYISLLTDRKETNINDSYRSRESRKQRAN